MEYTVNNLAKLAGISTRTLRYYDEIKLLKPARVNSSGYRIYGQKELDLLQQILFYRELGISLEEIREIIYAESFDRKKALKEHHGKLLEKKDQLDALIKTVEKTIAFTEGRITMSDREKFEGFKKTMIEENESKYGKEVREKYGKERIETSNQKLMSMTQGEYEEVTKIAQELMEALGNAFQTGDPSGELAQRAVALHKKWLCYYWDSYSKEAHAGLAQTYVDDERFRSYYDEKQPGTAEFLRDAILIYTSK